MEPQPLSREEAKALLAACPNTTTGIRDKAVFTTLYRAGTRIGETLRIRPGDIDWDRNLITLHWAKGGKGRTALIDDQALAVLRAWAERRKSLGINGHHPFFCATASDARGNQLSSSHYRREIKKLAEKAGITKRCHLHGLRHTCVSELLEENVSLPHIARQVGHEQLSTTSRYAHVLRPDLMNSHMKGREW